MVEVASVVARDLMRPDFLCIDESRPVSELVGLLKGTKYNDVLVFKGKKYVGMASLRFLLRKRLDASKTKVKTIIEKFPVVSVEDSFYRISELMYYTGARILPVEENNKIIGVVPSQRVIELIKSIDELRVLRAKDIAVKKPLSVEESIPLSKAIYLMKENKMRKLVVTKNRKISGVLSYTDIISKLVAAGVEAGHSFKLGDPRHSVEVGSVFSTPVVNFVSQNFALLNLNDSIIDVVTNVRKKKIGIVHSNLKPKGIITTKNLLQAILSTKIELRNIQIIGLPELDELDYAKAEKTISSFYDKVEKISKQRPLLKIHFKRYKESGLRSKHSIHAQLSIAGLSLNAASVGWTLLSTLQSVIKVLERKLSTKFSFRESYRRGINF